MPMQYQKVPLIATWVSIILAIVKFVIWIISWSVAILASAMDSLLDVWISIFNWFALKTASAPPDSKFNYGRWKIEGIAAIIEWVIIIWSWLFIIWESVSKILHKEVIQNIDLGLVVMIFSIVLVGGLVLYLSYIAKKTWNLVIKADLLHYKTDLLTNIGVIISLIIVKLTNIYYVDFIFWLVIGVYIIKEAFQLLKEGLDIILDKALEERDQIKEILNKFVKQWLIKSWHDLKTRKGWQYKFVEFHFVVDPDTTVKKAHDIGDIIADEVKKLDNKVYWEIIYHADRTDDSTCKSWV